MTPAWRALFGLTLLLLLAGAAAAQRGDQEQVDRFLRFLHSQTYTELLGHKALETDRQMPPRCEERSLTARKLFAVIQTPRFIDSREVPIEGEWAERVSVRRCGRTVEHNVFFYASRVRGLHAVAGLPGRTLTEPQLQVEVGRAVLARGRQRAPDCDSFDVVDTRVEREPPSPEAPWTERWTLYACGADVEVGVRFVPEPDGGWDFRLVN